MRGARGQVGATALAMLLLAACGGPSGTSPSPALLTAAPTPAGGATASPVQATGPASTPIVDAALCFVEKRSACRLAPGSYTTAPFERPFTFAISQPWRNVAASVHGGGLETTAGAGSFSWASGIESALPGEVDVGSAAAFVAFLQTASKLPGLTISAPVTATVGGMPATIIDVARADTAEALGFAVAEDVYFVRAGGTDRFWVVEVQGAFVLLIAESNRSGGFDNHVAAVQPVVDSITWK